MNEILSKIITDYKEIFILVFGIAYAVVFKTLLDRIRKRKKERNDKFFSALNSGFENGTIETYEDIVNIYEGITRMSTDDDGFKYGLKRWLKEYLVEIISKKEGDGISLIDKKQKVTEFIRRNEEIAPYDDIPVAEKNLLLDIITFAKEGKQEAIKRKIDELSGIIKTKNDVLGKIQNSNKYSTILAVVGLILTIIFGILALI